MRRGSKDPKGRTWKCECGSTTPWSETVWRRVESGEEPGPCCDNMSCFKFMVRVYQPGEIIPVPPGTNMMYLPEDSTARKEIPICTGFLDYFPLAAAAVARLSKKGNDKHNPGEPLHWSRGKSMDHADCIPRHLIDRGIIDPGTGESHTVALAWRALALLEEEEEKRLGVRMSRASKVAK